MLKMMSCVCVKYYVSFCLFVLKFARLKFNKKLLFCQIIAIFGVHFLYVVHGECMLVWTVLC